MLFDLSNEVPVSLIERIDFLGVAQIILSIIFFAIGGIAADDSGTDEYAPVALIAGGWLLITGILGVCSGFFFANKLLVGVYLSFNIIAMIGGAIGTIRYNVCVRR